MAPKPKAKASAKARSKATTSNPKASASRDQGLKSQQTASARSKAQDIAAIKASTLTVFFHKPDDPPFGFPSQWYMSHFTDPEVHATHSFNCAEQYMMYRKALLIASSSKSDEMRDLPDKILRSNKPGQQKFLAGPGSAKMNEVQMKEWDRVKYGVVVQGSYLKFTHNSELKAKLLATGVRELAEASMSDKVWGIGCTAHFAEQNRGKWGQNLLGKALMEVRERLRMEDEEEAEEREPGVGNKS